MSNLSMYEKYAAPPKDALKEFNNGRFKGTDINPMWRIKVLTEEYGECGFGWYPRINKMWREDSVYEDKEKGKIETSTVYCDLSLFVKRGDKWSEPIPGIGGNTMSKGAFTSDEGYKSAFTDALGIACKHLGIGAHIWWEPNDIKKQREERERLEWEKEAERKKAEATMQKAALKQRPNARNQNAALANVTVSARVEMSKEKRVERLNATMKKLNCNQTEFSAMRKDLIDRGIVANKSSADMTDNEYESFLSAMVKNFGGDSA